MNDKIDAIKTCINVCENSQNHDGELDWLMKTVVFARHQLEALKQSAVDKEKIIKANKILKKIWGLVSDQYWYNKDNLKKIEVGLNKTISLLTEAIKE